jgi:hypothetical protein
MQQPEHPAANQQCRSPCNRPPSRLAATMANAAEVSLRVVVPQLMNTDLGDMCSRLGAVDNSARLMLCIAIYRGGHCAVPG